MVEEINFKPLKDDAESVSGNWNAFLFSTHH